MPGCLAGALVVLTRPQGRNEALSQHLANEGFEPLSMPVLGIEPLAADLGSLPRPADYNLVIFVSGNAVRAYAQQLTQAGALPAQWPGHTLVGVVGQATADVVAHTGLAPADQVLCPALLHEQDSEALWQLLQPRLVSGQKALIVRGQDGREWLGQRLEQAGIRVTRHAAYQRCPVEWSVLSVQRLRDGVAAGRDIICLLTSAHGVQVFVDNAARHNLLAACRSFHYLVIHPRIAGRLQSLLEAASGKVDKLSVTICQPTDEAMLHAVKSLASL